MSVRRLALAVFLMSAIGLIGTGIVLQHTAELGLDVASREQQTPEGLAAFHKAEIEKWWPIIKAAGVKPE